MIRFKSLINGVGNYKETNKYYDDWSNSYDKKLHSWNYKTPLNSALFLHSLLLESPKSLLDLACGTGLFAEEILKFFPKIKIDGIDISEKILLIAKKKNIYKNLYCRNFDKNIKTTKKYDLISCIGAMTYTKDPKKLLLNIHKLTNKNGFFIFSHRIDLWKNQNYTELLSNIKEKWNQIKISRPLLYLPKNIDFNNKIKIKIVVLKKN